MISGAIEPIYISSFCYCHTSGAKNAINRRKKKKSSGPNSTETRKVIKTPTVIFKGDCLKMNGHIFQCAHESKDPKQFSRTKEELMRWSQTNYKQEDSDELRHMLRHMREAIFVLPTDPAVTANRTEERIWEAEVSDYIKGQKRYKGQKGSLFATIWGQCTHRPWWEQHSDLQNLRRNGRTFRRDCAT